MNEQTLHKADWTAVGTAFLAFFKIIPWPEIAAFLAALYTFLRLMGMALKWWRSK